jgi:DNA-binding MarR family transcriptional regulator
MKRLSAARKQDPSSDARTDEPLATVTLPALMPDGTDRSFRVFVHRLLAFSTRLEAIRSGFGTLLGLTGVQYSSLISIAHLGRDQAVGVKEVAEHLSLSGSFATLVIGQLVHRGLVAKQINPEDRRRVRLTVTKKGRDLLRRLAPVQQDVNDRLFGPLDAAKFAALNAVFADLVNSSEDATRLIQYLVGSGAPLAEGKP